MTINKIVLILCALSNLYSLPIVLAACIPIAIVFSVNHAIAFFLGYTTLHTLLLLFSPEYMIRERELLKQMIKGD